MRYYAPGEHPTTAIRMPAQGAEVRPATTYRCKLGYHNDCSRPQSCRCACHHGDAPTYAPAPTPDKAT